MADYREAMRAYIDTEVETLRALDLDGINEAANAIMAARERGGTIYTLGNGGSAATASHMVCDFAKGASDALGGRKFLFECLSDNVPSVTAIANDIGYGEVFAHQLRGRLRPGDLLIAISGSGNSESAVRAAKYAKGLGVPVVAMTGHGGGELMRVADHHMHVPIDDMQVTEDIHMLLDHMLLRVLCGCAR